MKSPFKTVLFVLSALLVLTACGKSNKVNLDVTVSDFHYDSDSYTVPAGAEVTLTLINNDPEEHEFAIMKLGTSVTPPFGDKDEGNIYWELDGVEANTSKTGTFTAPTVPGEYEVICGLAGHIEKGMVSKLIVK